MLCTHLDKPIDLNFRMNIRLIKPDRKVEIGDNISLAVIAHAYKPLGGSSNDFPLKMMSRWFKQVGFFVILYDRKSTSWTGDIEVEEYTSILKEVVSTQLSQYSLSKVIIGVCTSERTT